MLTGGLGADTYTYTRGDGNDTVQETQETGITNVLKLKNISPEMVSLERVGTDLLVKVGESSIGASDGGTILLIGIIGAAGHYDQYGLQSIVFDDGTVWTAAYLRQWSVFDSATDGNDVLVGADAAGDFGGGKGDDALNAGDGSDTYLYSRGDGHDVITEASSRGAEDKLMLTDVNSSQVTLERTGLDLKLVISESASGVGDNGSIVLISTLDNYNEQGVEKIVFANGTIWTMADLRQVLLRKRLRPKMIPLPAFG